MKPGYRRTVEQCKALLALELQAYARGIESCVRVPLPDARFVALTSFAYNVGVRVACGIYKSGRWKTARVFRFSPHRLERYANASSRVPVIKRLFGEEDELSAALS
ncbi:hypothetical protein ABID08_004957 [Rhizobium binae]|uniref:Lysozyme n=1 Tax=Rhizobium binae TaxID=1138190 RepID=A0ABV2MM98_9HYPH